MPALRPFALVRTSDQWARMAHVRTRIDSRDAAVELDFDDAASPTAPPGQAPPLAGGLAFDGACRLYRSIPDEGRIERVLWAAWDPLDPPDRVAEPLDLVAVPVASPRGDFGPVELPQPLRRPLDLAVDVDDRLYVAEHTARRILVYDLWSGRLLRRISTAPHRPLDLACRERTVWAVLSDPPGLARMRARGDLDDTPLPATVRPAAARLVRVALAPDGEPHLLFADGAGGSVVVPLDHPSEDQSVAGATDLEFDGDGALVVARRPGETMLRFRRELGAWFGERPLAALGYDGYGIARAPDGRIVFWSGRGLRRGLAARVRYRRDGRVATFALDSGEFGTEWGRIFLDACVPEGTSLRVAAVAGDDDPRDTGEATGPRTPPANASELDVPHAELSPPLAPASLRLADAPRRLVHRRESGRELPWARPAADDPFETYEASVAAGVGRYLWVTLELRGNTRATPRVRCLRAEHPGHDLLRRLPRVFSRDEAMASFLRRYLAPPDGLLSDLEARSSERRALVDPAAAPVELLPWLAAFVGLVLDERWPASSRRRLIADAARLFRFRGTIASLTRFLELYLGRPPILIEHWRLRGLGGALVGGGTPGTAAAGSIVGGNFRVGGAVGAEGERPLEATVENAFEAHAHRFSVVVPALLSREQEDVVRHVLDVHRPAHTLVDVCTVGAGMRVGLGLHVELLSLIGRTGGFAPLRVGGGLLGRGGILGRAEPGTRPGSGRLARDTRVG